MVAGSGVVMLLEGCVQTRVDPWYIITTNYACRMLLSDTLGVTSLVNCLNHRLAGAAGSTEWTVQVLWRI